MEKATSKPFAVPLDLLKQFKSDVRTIPNNLPHNGYIVFDKAMLSQILREGSAKDRLELAKQIDKLGEAGGELTIIGVR